MKQPWWWWFRYWLRGWFWSFEYQSGPVVACLHLGLFHLWWFTHGNGGDTPERIYFGWNWD